jgi:hypothetical protein
MGFLRRLLGGEPAERGSPAPDDEPGVDQADIDAAEDAYQRDLLREEQERLTDLTRRQLRYAEHAWKPPDQGDARRADDAETPADDA